MARAINLLTFSEFELKPRETAPTHIKKYVNRLNNMFTAMKHYQASQEKAMLLQYLWEETCNVFETKGSVKYKTAIKVLTVYFEPRKCVDPQVYVFCQETQRSGENITKFYAHLQLLAGKCDFTNNKLEIKQQIIQGTSKVHLRCKAIKQNLNLESILKGCSRLRNNNHTPWATAEVKQGMINRNDGWASQH